MTKIISKREREMLFHTVGIVLLVPSFPRMHVVLVDQIKHKRLLTDNASEGSFMCESLFNEIQN